MKHLTKLLAALGLLLTLTCCTTEREYTADPYANYDRLWRSSTVAIATSTSSSLKAPPGVTSTTSTAVTCAQRDD